MAKRIDLSSLITEASIKDPLLQQVIKVQRTVGRISKNTANNMNISPRDRGGLINALGEISDQLDELGSVIEKNINEKKVAENINEASNETIEKMDSIVSDESLFKLVDAMRRIIRTLQEEGFDNDDIFDYIVLNVKTLGR
jgi:predicted transcriptional regulator YheO